MCDKAMRMMDKISSLLDRFEGKRLIRTKCVQATMPLYEKCCRLERYFSCTLWYTSSVPVWQFSVNCSMSLRRVLSKTTSLRASCAGEPGRSRRFVLAFSLGMGGWGHSWYKSALSHEWMLAEWWTMEIHFSSKRFLSPSQVAQRARWRGTILQSMFVWTWRKLAISESNLS